MRKPLSEQARAFRERVLEELKPYMVNECQFHFSFKTKGDTEYLHLDIIEDYCNHLHIRGWFNDELIEITSISCNTTHDTFGEVITFMIENY